MARIITDPDGRMALLRDHRILDIVGLSAKPNRPSHFVGVYMLAEGYEVTPINPREGEILGRKSWPSLTAMADGLGRAPVVVDIFRRPEEVDAIVDEAIQLGAKAIWMQLGIVNQPAAERAVAAGMDVVMDRCVKIEHARFFGGLHTIGLNTEVLSAKPRPVSRSKLKND